MIEPLVLYVAGVVTGPVFKPIVRGAVKGTIKLGLQAKKLATDAASEVKGMATETRADDSSLVIATTAAPK